MLHFSVYIDNTSNICILERREHSSLVVVEILAKLSTLQLSDKSVHIVSFHVLILVETRE